MNLNLSSEQNVIERDVHCPFCQYDKGMLISGVSEKRSVLQFPDYGKKYWLCVLFTFGLYMFIHGFPMFEKKRTIEYNTYGFCPKCGKTYNAGTPAAVKSTKAKSPKVYRSLENKKIFGICGGISKFTGLSSTLVRISMIFQSICVIPAILYFIIGLFKLMPLNPKHDNRLSK